MDAFLDNFALCDLTAAKCIFGKYSFEFDRHDKTLHCITPTLWRKLVDNRQVDYRDTLRDVITEARDVGLFEQTQDFPRVYDASRLQTKTGRKINGAIVANQDGILSFGPHVVIPRGRYIAHVDARMLDGEGSITLHVTLEHGAQHLGARTITLVRGAVTPEFTIPFEINTAFGHDFELVCEVYGVRQATLHRVVITRNEIADEHHAGEHVFDSAHLRPVNALRANGMIVSAAPHGVLVGSPWVQLPRGAYVAAIEMERASGNGEIGIQVIFDRSRSAAEERSFVVAASPSVLQVPFVIDAAEHCGVEVICSMRDMESVAVRQITISPDPQELGRPKGAQKLADLLRRLQR